MSHLLQVKEGVEVIVDDLVACWSASKALTQSQQNYPQIEKEMLGIVFGCESFHDYLYGQREVIVETDETHT